MAKQRDDGFMELEKRYDGYEVRDRDGEKIGKVDDLFADENDNPEYIGVKMGFLGTRSTLIPTDIVTVREDRDVIEVAAEKGKVKDGPSFDDDEEITPDYEERVRDYYGLEGSRGTESWGAYGTFDYYSSEERRRGEETRDEEILAGGRPGASGPGTRTGDVGHERGGYSEAERRDREQRDRSGEVGAGVRTGGTGTGRGRTRQQEGIGQLGSDHEKEEDIRVQRSEEELRAGTREREVGGLRVRKRVRTEREQVRVPKRREEVHVERVPVEGREATEADIGEDEVFMPLAEEEVVVEKRPVVKEEIRVHKNVAREEEIVEEDVRKEEVDIDDPSQRLEKDTDVNGASRRRRDR